VAANHKDWTMIAVILSGLRALYREHRTRRDLRRVHALDDHSLRDIGLTRSDIEDAVRTGARPSLQGAPF